MTPVRNRIVSALVAGLAMALAVAPSRAADSVASFYQGKVLNIYNAGGVGGPYDARLRTLEPYLNKYLPGSPTIVIQSLPGAGGERAANSIYKLMPRDGTALALLLPTIAFNQAIGMGGIQYDAAKLQYIGSFDPLDQAVVVTPSAPARTLADAKRIEVAFGSSGRGSSSWIVPALMNRYLGTKFHIVTGYPGVSDVFLAMDRGELAGIAVNWYSIAIGRPAWQPGKTIFGLAQSGLRRVPELPDVPTLIELAENDDQRQVLEFYALSTALGVVLVAPPEVPQDRLQALRTAVEKSFADPGFIADAKARGLSLHPTGGAELEGLVAKTLATPRSVTDQIRDLLGMK
jgi:tripartite-type tricarboxylate transporter receptor subunit TctC